MRTENQNRGPGFYLPFAGRVARLESLVRWILTLPQWRTLTNAQIVAHMCEHYTLHPLPFGLTLFRRRPYEDVTTELLDPSPRPRDPR